MTTIDFYILKSKTPTHDLFACKLTEKIYKNGHRLFINTRDQQQGQLLDTMLWTFRDLSFVPHSLSQADSDNNHQNRDQIQLAYNINPGEQHSCEVLLNLADQVPTFFSSFPRVAEIVSQTGEQKKVARERFKFYRDRGYKINTHEI